MNPPARQHVQAAGALAVLAALAFAAPAAARDSALPAPVAVTCPAAEASAPVPGELTDGPPLAEELPDDAVGSQPEVDAPAEAAGAPASLSIGSPDAGLLVNAVAMPEGPFWTIRNPAESYGTTETVAYLRRAIESVQLQFPDSPRVVIGDISRAAGGRLNRHRSHQSGRDVDLGLYYRGGEAGDFKGADARSLDVERTWALVKALATETDVEHIFLDRSLQRLLLAQARELGEEAWFGELTGRARSGQDAILQHERRHRDHMHVRFYNPEAQECARTSHEQLVAQGVLPPPTLRYRVRTGESLSTIARRHGVSVTAIQRANGMRSSFVRAGNTLLIPLRRVPVAEGPLAIPPRLLPPGAEPAAPAQLHDTGGFGDGGGQR